MKDLRSDWIVWIGEPIVRIGNKTFYSDINVITPSTAVLKRDRVTLELPPDGDQPELADKFRYGRLKGKIGSFFRVSNPEHNQKPGEVVQIVQLFEAHDAKEDKYRAIVKWFVDCTSLSKNVANYKRIKHKLNFADEIILDDTRDPNTDISIRKLWGRCHVIFGRTTEGPPEMPQKQRPVYLCRYKVTELYGRTQLEPYFSDDEDEMPVSDKKLHMVPVVELESLNAPVPGSPRIPRSDPSTRLCGKRSMNGKCIVVEKAAVPNGEVVTVTDSEGETEVEHKNTKVPLRRLPHAKLTEEEIVSLLTADDDIDSDDNIFSDFEDEASDDKKPNGVNHAQRKEVLLSNALRSASSNSSIMGRQRRTRDTSSSDDDYNERCRIKRRKLELVATPASSSKQPKQPHLPHKDESSLPVSEARMTRTSPTVSRPSGLKGDMLFESKGSSRTPKKNLGLQPKPSDIPTTEVQIVSPSKSRTAELKDDVISDSKASSRTPKKNFGLQRKLSEVTATEMVSDTRMTRASPTKSRPRTAELKDDVISEPKASSRTPKKNSGLQQKLSEVTETVSDTRVTRASPIKSKPSQLKADVLPDSKASPRTPKKKLIAELHSSPAGNPVIQTCESRHETPRKTGRVKLLHSSTPRPSEKTSLIAQDSPDNVLKRSSPRTPVANKRYNDCWLEGVKLKPQPEKAMEEAKSNKQRQIRTTTQVQQASSLTNSPRTPRHKQKSVEQEEEKSCKELQSKTNLKHNYLNSHTGSPRTPRSRKKTVQKEEENEQVQLKLTPRIQQVSNTGSPRTPRSRRQKVVDEELEDGQVHVKSSVRVQQPSSNSNSPRTPRSRKGSSVHRALLTPSMPSRGHSVESPSSLLEVVRSRLCVSAVPKSLPCRENEFNNIYHFLEGKIIDRASGCMYVSGVPGTGKTATVQEVLRSLKNKADYKEIPGFELVDLNGMRMTEPRQAYVQLYKALTGQTVVADQAQQLLEKRFSTSRKKQNTTVVIVDELDMLCTRRQDVVYNLLDWPTKASSHLVVVTIANTMDLPEKLLKGRVTSRLGLTRVTFQPYTFQQLKIIVMERLKGLNVFDHDAIELVSRKVAAVSGDARRALDICRRATELAEGRADVVGMQHVDEAVREMSTSATVKMIKNCSTLEQNFLKAVLARMQASGLDETSFRAVYDEMFAICTFDGIKVPSVTEALQICAALGSARLLIVKHSRYDIHQDILLNVSRDDLHYALKVGAA